MDSYLFCRKTIRSRAWSFTSSLLTMTKRTVFKLSPNGRLYWGPVSPTTSKRTFVSPTGEWYLSYDSIYFETGRCHTVKCLILQLSFVHPIYITKGGGGRWGHQEFYLEGWSLIEIEVWCPERWNMTILCFIFMWTGN